jgi:hypothetical protein
MTAKPRHRFEAMIEISCLRLGSARRERLP